MSIVATPIAHPPFPNIHIFPSSSSVSAHAELPPALHDVRQPLIPFPTFQHRHSSPFPTQSFSALGPPASAPLKALVAIPPPPAPRPPPIQLPSFPLGVLESTLQSPLPPTPDPSPPNSKMLLPTVMVMLAPPAGESTEHLRTIEPMETQVIDGTPRRVPTIAIGSLTVDSSPVNLGAGSSARPLQGPSTGIEAPFAHPRPMGPSNRPIRRSQIANHPSAVQMIESQSADSRVRARSRAAMGSRHHGSHTPPFALSAPSGLPRTLTEPCSTPDLGGPDELEAKVVLLGSQGVGKTSLILRFTTRIFSPSPAAATIGSSLHTRKLVHSGVRVKLQIWDTAGQERFRSMAPIYYRGAHVCVLVYDISDQASFDDVRSWLEELGRTVPKETVIFVVGSKVDLHARRAVQ